MRKMRFKKEKGVFLPFLQAVNVATEHNRGVSTLGAQTKHNTTQHNTTQHNKTKQNKTKQNKTKQNSRRVHFLLEVS
jgi:hypothetical protein